MSDDEEGVAIETAHHDAAEQAMFMHELQAAGMNGGHAAVESADWATIAAEMHAAGGNGQFLAGGGVGQLDMSRNEASDRSSASDDDDETTMHTAVHGMAVGGNDGIGVGLDLYDSEDAETVMLQQHEQDVAERMLATFGAGEADQLLNSLRTLLDNTQARNVRLFVQAPTNNIGLNMGGGLTMGDLSRLTSYTPGVTAGEPTSTVNFIHPLLQPPADLVLSPLSMLTPANAGNGDETFDPMSNMMDSQATMLRWRRHAGLDAAVAGGAWRGLHRQNAIRERASIGGGSRRRTHASHLFGTTSAAAQLTPTEHSIITRVLNNNQNAAIVAPTQLATAVESVSHNSAIDGDTSTVGTASQAQQLQQQQMLQAAVQPRQLRVTLANGLNADTTATMLQTLHSPHLMRWDVSGTGGELMQMPANVPSALTRWTELSALLDAQAASSLAVLIRQPLMDALLRHLPPPTATPPVVSGSRRPDIGQPLVTPAGPHVVLTDLNSASSAATQSADVAPTNESNEHRNVDNAILVVAPSTAPESSSNVPAQITALGDDESQTMDFGRSSTPAVADAPLSTSGGQPDELTQTLALATDDQQATTSIAALSADEQHRRLVDQWRAELGDLQVPIGIDPEFIAALPPDMRQSVINEHQQRERVTQLRTRPMITSAATAAPVTPMADIDQEFLDALPPELQEEVLAQRRAAQANEAAAARAQQTADDPATFFDSLPPSLRQQVLADADDSVIAALPMQLANEARRLRERVDRMHAARLVQMQEHLQHADELTLHGTDHQWMHGRRFGRTFAGRRGNGGRIGQTTSSAVAGAAASAALERHHKTNGLQLVDKEAMCALLVLFLTDTNRVQHNRLQKIIKSLCTHAPTCDFIIRAMLTMLDKMPPTTMSPSGDVVSADVSSRTLSGGGCGRWLDRLVIDTGLGNRAPVLSMRSDGTQVGIHHMVSETVGRALLDTLISLAKAYPLQFLPNVLRQRPNDTANTLEESSSVTDDKGDEFWSMLARLNTLDLSTAANVPDATAEADSTALGKKMSRQEKATEQPAVEQVTPSEYTYLTLDACPLAHALQLTRHSLINSQPPLLDRLFKLISHVAQTMPMNMCTEHSSICVSSDANDGEPIPLRELIRTLVNTVTTCACTDEGLADGRIVILELVRACGRPLRYFVYSCLVNGARTLAVQLHKEIEQLNTELAVVNERLINQVGTATPQTMDMDPAGPSTRQPYTLAEQREGTLISRFDTSQQIVLQHDAHGRSGLRAVGGAAGTQTVASQCEHMQVPSVAALTKRHNTQTLLLRTLQTFIRLRDAMRALDADVRKRADDLRREQDERKVEEALVKAMAEAEQIEGESEADRRTRLTVQLRASMHEEQDTAVSTAPTEKIVEDEPLSTALQAGAEQPYNQLWTAVGACLTQLNEATDQQAVVILQPAAECFFIVHASASDNERTQRRQRRMARAPGRQLPGQPPAAAVEQQPMDEHVMDQAGEQTAALVTTRESLSIDANLPIDLRHMIEFAQQHRRILNVVLRNTQTNLADGPFAILLDYPRLLDFDVKRKHFRAELRRLEDRTRRGEDIAIRVRRSHVFQDSFRELHRIRSVQWKARFYVVFQGEEGQDAGGVLREWYLVVCREIFNPDYALFEVAPGDGVTYMINKSSHVNDEHLDYFKFVGRVIAKAIYDNKLLDCYFTRAFYKHILNKPVTFTDIQAQDNAYYESLLYLLNHPVEHLGYELTFCTEVDEFGTLQKRELKPDGDKILVTDDNKKEYVQLITQLKMTSSIRQQLKAFLTGFYEVIPRDLISMFDEQELELLISGLPNVDVDDLQANTEYRGYTRESAQVKWFWRCMRAFEQEDRAKFLQFVTGTSKVPLQGFAHLEGMNGPQRLSIVKDNRQTDRLPAAHTCFNQLDLPEYESYEKLVEMLTLAIRECSEGFGFA